MGKILGRRPGLVAAAFFSFLAMSAAWALAVPIDGAPDEREHILRAAGVARGEFLVEPGSFINGGGGLVTAPASFDALTMTAECFKFHPEQPAGCQSRGPGGAELGRYPDAAARYFPVYYFLVGLPSLGFTSLLGIYLMRFSSSLMSALFFASAIDSAASAGLSPLLVMGVWAAVTPMTMFLSGVINPNSWEITAALSLWTAGVTLSFGRAKGLERRLIATMAISAISMLFTRSLAPLWVVLILAALTVATGRLRMFRLLQTRTAIIWGGLVALATAASIIWTVVAGTLSVAGVEHQLSLLSRLQTSVNLLPSRLDEMIGYFGWLDAPSPAVTYFAWALALALLIVPALTTRLMRPRIALLGLIAATLFIPILLEVYAANRLGFFWQGRYTLPLAVGVPLLAAAIQARGGAVGAAAVNRLLPWAIVALAIAQFMALWFAMIRFQSGVGTTLNPLTGSWHPPGGSLSVLALAVVGLAAGSLVVVRGGRNVNSAAQRSAAATDS